MAWNLTRNKGGYVLETLGLFIWALHTNNFHVQEIADPVLHHSVQITNPWDLAIWMRKMRSRLERAICSCGFLFKFACYAICSTFLSLWRIRPRHGFGFALLFWRCCERRVSGMLMLIFVLLAKPWRKRTGFVYFGLQLDHLQSHVCQGSKRGFCAFTEQPHIPLMGVSSNGQFMTKIAEPYPHQLCRVLARAFLDWHTQVIADNFWKRLMPDGTAKQTAGSNAG